MPDDTCPPLSGSRTHPPDSGLWISNYNTTIGTSVHVTCRLPHWKQNGTLILSCEPGRLWNGTVSECFQTVDDTGINNTDGNFQRSITAEVIIIWAVGGIMLVTLLSLLIAILCARRKEIQAEERRRQTSQGTPSNQGEQNFAFAIDPAYQDHCQTIGNSTIVFPTAPPPYPGSIRRGNTRDNNGTSSASAFTNDTTNTGNNTQTNASASDSIHASAPSRNAINSDPSRSAFTPVSGVQSPISSHRPPPSVPSASTSSTIADYIGPPRMAYSDIFEPPPPYTRYPEYSMPSTSRASDNRGQRSAPRQPASRGATTAVATHTTVARVHVPARPRHVEYSTYI